MIPGSNLLNMALSVIAAQSFQYVAWVSRAPTANGLFDNTYAAPVTARGSVQPVPRELYEKYNLDFQKTYIVVYVPRNILDLNRDVSTDQIIFNGATYNCLSDTPWYPIDGWTAVICVKVPANA